MQCLYWNFDLASNEERNLVWNFCVKSCLMMAFERLRSATTPEQMCFLYSQLHSHQRHCTYIDSLLLVNNTTLRLRQSKESIVPKNLRWYYYYYYYYWANKKHWKHSTYLLRCNWSSYCSIFYKNNNWMLIFRLFLPKPSSQPFVLPIKMPSWYVA